MKKKMILTSVAMALMTVLGIGFTAPAFADVTCPDGAVRGTAPTLAECNLKDDNSLLPTVNSIINVAVGVIGLVAVIAIIIGGFNYVMSQGDPGKIKKAKDTIMYGVIGLIVALLAFAIVNFVLKNVFN